MKRKFFLPLMMFVLLVAASMLLISYTHAKTSADNNKECTDDGKCNRKKVQSEFILWESFSRNLFGSNS